MNELIMGKTWPEIQMMQGATMETWHEYGVNSQHRARINGKDLVGYHETEIGLCSALEEICVSPSRMIASGQNVYKGEKETIINYWVMTKTYD